MIVEESNSHLKESGIIQFVSGKILNLVDREPQWYIPKTKKSLMYI